MQRHLSTNYYKYIAVKTKLFQILYDQQPLLNGQVMEKGNLYDRTKHKYFWKAIFNISLGAPKLWCPGTRSLVPFQVDQGKGHQSSGARAPDVWCPSKLTYRFFVLISRMGFRTLIFCCLAIVFMCSTQNLVLSEHGQHEWACSDEKTLKK